MAALREMSKSYNVGLIDQTAIREVESVAATIHELIAGRTEALGDKPKAELACAVLGAADEAEVRTLAQILTSFQALLRSTVTLEERLNVMTWKVVASFIAPESQQQDGPESVPCDKVFRSPLGVVG